MSRYPQVRPGQRNLPAEAFNTAMRDLEMLARLNVSGGTFSKGASGVMINVDQPDGLMLLGKASPTEVDEYPTFDAELKVFPVKLLIGPSWDIDDHTAEYTQSTIQEPAVDVYNIPGCWVYEDDIVLVWRLNGQYWMNHNVYRVGVAAETIDKGDLGAINVNGTEIQARALYGSTASGKKVGIEFDGFELIISEEEC